MTDMIQISRAELARIHALLGAHLGQEVAAALSKTSKTATKTTEKKPRANAGMSTAHGDYTKKVLAEHGKDSAEFKAFLAKRVAAAEAGEMAYTADQAKVKTGKKAVGDLMDAKEAAAGAHIPFVAHWKVTHPEEWQAFKATWEVEHPKGARSAAGSAAASVADDASVAGSEAAESVAPAKKARKPQSEETKAKAAAKRAATKAAKAGAAVPNAEPASAEDEAEEEEAVSLPEQAEEAQEAESVELETEDSLIDWTSPKGKVYLRVGHLDTEGDGVWNEGNWLWAKNADGSKGAYAGILLASGKIDSSPTTLAEEPEIE